MREARLGAHVQADGVRFSVWSGAAERAWLSLFDDQDRESARMEMTQDEGGVYSVFVPGLKAGARYGFRADGPYDPQSGLWFDPDKLLVDPYALEVDRPYRYDTRLAAPRGEGGDTAPLMPKTVVCNLPDLPLRPPLFEPGGLIYEINVRAFTMRHLEVPEAQRGTLCALAHPAIIDHLRALRVSAVELMPITAWMDERHLPPLGLHNAWGYNPISFMALDPRLAPGGWRELRDTVAALHEAGIGVILDLVFNHTAESDVLGPTLSLRGLDARAYYRHDGQGRLVNDTGTGNTVACDLPVVQGLVLDTLRAFIRYAGVDGFRFDLAPILGRDASGFRPDAPLLRTMVEDAEIGSRVLIAEPWDIGPGGYQLGNFPAPFLEWNDMFRDDVRRFRRGDPGMIGRLATRLAGSSDIFTGERTRSINFLAAHDGMTLADLVAYQHKHNHANGEDNRDGHSENLSWNHGVEGPSGDTQVVALRRRDLKALLALLFASRGAIMLTAGDEFGRTQGGNNNAYGQDNEITWLDWAGRDRDLEAFVRELGELRSRHAVLRDTTLLGEGNVQWLREDGEPMTVADWEDPARRSLVMVLGDVRVTIGPDDVTIAGRETADG
jgi:glycogen operon protein